MDEKFRADKEVVLLAVNQSGHTLAFASETLKAELTGADPCVFFGLLWNRESQDDSASSEGK